MKTEPFYSQVEDKRVKISEVGAESSGKFRILL